MLATLEVGAWMERQKLAASPRCRTLPKGEVYRHHSGGCRLLLGGVTISERQFTVKGESALYSIFLPPRSPDTGKSGAVVHVRFVLAVNGSQVVRATDLTVFGTPRPPIACQAVGGYCPDGLGVHSVAISQLQGGHWIQTQRLRPNAQATFKIAYVATMQDPRPPSSRNRSLRPPSVKLQVRIKNSGQTVLTASAQQQPQLGQQATLSAASAMVGRKLVGPLVAAFTVWFGCATTLRRELAFTVGLGSGAPKTQPFQLFHYRFGQLVQTDALNANETGFFVAYVDPIPGGPRAAEGYVQIVKNGDAVYIGDTSAACDSFAYGDGINLCLDSEAFAGQYALERTVRFPQTFTGQADAVFTIQDRRGTHIGHFCFAVGRTPACP